MYLKIVKKGFFQVDICEKGGLQSAGWKQQIWQGTSSPKASMGKICCGCCGVQQQEHIAVSGRIWVASGALQTVIVVHSQRSTWTVLKTSLTQVRLSTHPAQSRPGGIMCWAGRHYPSYRSVKKWGKIMTSFLHIFLRLCLL